MAEQGLVNADAVRTRAEVALGEYVGEMTRIKHSIKLASKLIYAVQSKRTGNNKKNPR